MHGPQAFGLLFLVIFVLNIPTFLFGFLTVKCTLYLFPRTKGFFFIRWVFPFLAGFVLFLFGACLTFVHLEQPWPTSPALSGWGCLGLICLVDLGLFLLWAYLKYREYKRALAVLTTKVGEIVSLPTRADR